MEHSKILGLDPFQAGLGLMALLCGAVFFYVGVRNPGKENESKWRQWWTYADVFAVVLTIIGVVKIMSPLIGAMQTQADANKRNIVMNLKEDVLRTLGKAEEQFCPVAGMAGENMARCTVIRKMQRALYMPRANYSTAKRLLDDDLPAMCAVAGCAEPFDDVKQKLVAFRSYYLENRGVIDSSPQTTEDDVIYTMAFVVFYALVAALRFGRSGAEFERNRLAQKEAAEKLGRPKSNNGLEDVYRRIEHLEELIAALKRDSDTFENRHAGLQALKAATPSARRFR